MPFLTRLNGCAILLAVAALPACAQLQSHFTRMEVIHGKPYVMVMVNGKGPFRFVIDTGTGGQALVTSALADQLALPIVGQARLTDPSGQGEQRAQILLIDSLNVAGVEFTGVKAIRHGLAAEDSTCQGLLGFTLFRDYLLKLDYPNQRMNLAPGSLAPDGERSVLPFRMPDGVPIVPLRINGMRVEAQFDSGGIGLSLPRQIASQLKFVSDPAVFAIGESLSTRFEMMAGRLGSDVHVGRYAFDQPVVEINPAFPLANFGGCAMRNFAVTFDQNNLLLRLDSEKTTFRLGPEATFLRLQNAPPPKPPDLALVPVG
ncbi:MAG: aspartyl protease family protein [Acidobacteriota bacterium]|nr:aspartyl protease family protein [Acidobacteriota bacterium]